MKLRLLLGVLVVTLVSCVSPLKQLQEPMANFKAGLDTTANISYFHVNRLNEAILKYKMLEVNKSTGRPDYSSITNNQENENKKLLQMYDLIRMITMYQQKLYKAAFSKEGEEFKKNAEEVGVYVGGVATTLASVVAIPGVSSAAVSAIKSAIEEIGKAAIEQKNKKDFLKIVANSGEGISKAIKELSVVVDSYYLKGTVFTDDILIYESDKLAMYQQEYKDNKNKPLTEKSIKSREALDEKISRMADVIAYYNILYAIKPSVLINALSEANEALIQFAQTDPETALSRDKLANAMVKFQLTAQAYSTAISNLKALEATLFETKATKDKSKE